MTTQRTVVVAMSGGVDSSVAAGLLVEQGHNVIGVTLLLRPCDDDGKVSWCCGFGAQESARGVCQTLGIPHYTFDCASQFEQMVLRPSWEEYDRGRTPSPCILCNQYLKFGTLLERARKLGASEIATGHYSMIQMEQSGERHLLRGLDSSKDQSYFLFSLSGDQLAHTIFPLGELTKPRVREIAARMGLPSAARPDSQDACFTTFDGGGFSEALRRRFEAAPRRGPVLDDDGRTIGAHEGIHHYTIGQRRGLRIALGKRAYVSSIDPTGAAVTLSENPDHLLAGGLIASALRWTGDVVPTFPIRCQAQIRYRHTPVAATGTLAPDGRLVVDFDRPQRSVAPGQAVVLYDDRRVIGGGWIERATDPEPK